VKLEIGNFHVRDIQYGSQTAFKDGILTVNKEEAINILNADKKLKNVDLHIVRPGDKVRMLPVKDAVEPRVRPDGRAVFPGYTGPVTPCGDGVVHALKDMSVIVVGKYGDWMDGILDMSGPAAEMTIFSKLINLVIVAEEERKPQTHDERHENSAVFRLAAHLLAEYVGAAVKDQQPDEWERFELEKIDDELPKVALVMHLQTQKVVNAGHNHLLYGRDVGNTFPTLGHPNEVLDGALVSDVISLPASRFVTYEFQNFPLIKSLYRAHGKTIHFVGVIFSTCEVPIQGKERAAIRVVNIASMLECDGAVVLIRGSGNVDVDFFKSIIGLEEKGIKVVGCTPIMPGRDCTSPPKTVMDARADAITCGGSDGGVIELPTMETVLGDLASISRDNYPGAWSEDPAYGPSLRKDGSIIVDTYTIFLNNGSSGYSNKTIREF